MSAGVYVEEAQGWARFLFDAEVRRRGSADDALNTVARSAKVPRSKVWSLVYRPHVLKDIGASIYFGLLAAYERECARQAQLAELQHAQAVAKSRAAAPLVRAAAALRRCPAGEAEDCA